MAPDRFDLTAPVHLDGRLKLVDRAACESTSELLGQVLSDRGRNRPREHIEVAVVPGHHSRAGSDTMVGVTCDPTDVEDKQSMRVGGVVLDIADQALDRDVREIPVRMIQHDGLAHPQHLTSTPQLLITQPGKVTDTGPEGRSLAPGQAQHRNLCPAIDQFGHEGTQSEGFVVRMSHHTHDVALRCYEVEHGGQAPISGGRCHPGPNTDHAHILKLPSIVGHGIRIPQKRPMVISQEHEDRNGSIIMRDPSSARPALFYDRWFDSRWGRYASAIERRALVAALRPIDGALVLDAGCGTGRFGEDLEQAGATVVGLDPDPDMLDLARVRLTAPLLRADALMLPFPPSSFDVTVAVTVIEFVEDQARLVAELARVTRPGGRLCLATLNPHSPWGLAHRRRLRRPPWDRARFVPRSTLHKMVAPFGSVTGHAVLFAPGSMPGLSLVGLLLEPARYLFPRAGAFQIVVVQRR